MNTTHNEDEATAPETYAPLDLAEHLGSDQEIAAFLEILLAEGSPTEIAAGLGHVARARGMAQVARDAGLSRESLYKALSENGNPEFATILKVVRALGLKLVPVPA